LLYYSTIANIDYILCLKNDALDLLFNEYKRLPRIKCLPETRHVSHRFVSKTKIRFLGIIVFK